MRQFVVMGVSGSGKSSVGAAVAERLGAEFIDGDDLHTASNVDKMSRGVPLNDTDRLPWLRAVGQKLADTSPPVIIACSALKKSYRDTIREKAGGDVCFLFLQGSADVLKSRMENRPGHFMPPSLLDSQLDTLEPPQADELAVTADIDQPFNHLVARIVLQISKDIS